MAIQLSAAVRNARLDAIETQIGVAGATLKIRTLAQPTDCAAADVGTVLATMTLASDWMATAAAGTKAKQGTWQDASADAAGTAAHFRLYDAAGTVCGMQGSVGQGTGDLSLDNTNIAAGQQVTINTFTLTDGNA
jgi:hypothetical protein